MKPLKSARTAALGTALALLLFGGAYAGVAYAGQRAFGPPPGEPGMGMMRGGPGGMFMGRLAEQLGITDAQKQQIKAIMRQNRTQIAPLAQAAGQAREKLMDDARTNGDDSTLQADANALGSAEAQLQLATAKIQAQIFNQVLTPDQQQKALQLRDEMKQRMQQRQQRRGQGR